MKLRLASAVTVGLVILALACPSLGRGGGGGTFRSSSSSSSSSRSSSSSSSSSSRSSSSTTSSSSSSRSSTTSTSSSNRSSYNPSSSSSSNRSSVYHPGTSSDNRSTVVYPNSNGGPRSTVVYPHSTGGTRSTVVYPNPSGGTRSTYPRNSGVTNPYPTNPGVAQNQPGPAPVSYFRRVLSFGFCFVLALLGSQWMLKILESRREEILAQAFVTSPGLRRDLVVCALLAMLEYVVVGPKLTALLILGVSLRLGGRGRLKNLTICVGEPVARLDALLQADPNFSLPIFREFAVLLYCQAQHERLTNFPQCRGYLSMLSQDMLRQRNRETTQVQDVVVGTCKLLDSRVEDGAVVVRVAYETNYLEQSQGLQAYVANEVWEFRRRLGVTTKPPKQVLKLACPNCGFAGELGVDGKCPQCEKVNARGEFDWIVETIELESLEPFAPYSADQSGVEIGTDKPTPRHPDFEMRKRDLMARNPGFSWEEFQSKACGIFLKVQEAWTTRQWSLVRPHETDIIFRTHRYWIEDYLRAGRVNRLKDIKVTDFIISNIVTDPFYESITVRIFAEMIDYTEEVLGGRIVSGDPKNPRCFSEYWSFVRRIGHGSPSGDSLRQCPSCGAALDRVNQAGVCEYCDTLVSSGDFDWVLSYIEQDEVYEIAL